MDMAKKRLTGPLTAEQLIAELAADPEIQRRRAVFEAKAKVDHEAYSRAERPVVEALQASGFDVESVWDLVNTKEPYIGALPILLAHLQRDYPAKVREAIARAMAVPDSRFAWQTLLSLFKRDFDREPNGVKMAVGLALSAAADDSVMSDVIALVSDPRHGQNRIVLIAALKRSRTANARAALEAARNDAELQAEVSRLLDTPKRRGRRTRP